MYKFSSPYHGTSNDDVRHCMQHNSNTDKNKASILPCNFTGILRGWWNNYLSEENKREILNVVKQEGNQQPREDVVYTLILAIIEHFTRNVIDQGDKTRTLLQNLKCPTLTHFRWYKDTFISRVMNLVDANSIH